MAKTNRKPRNGGVTRTSAVTPAPPPAAFQGDSSTTTPSTPPTTPLITVEAPAAPAAAAAAMTAATATPPDGTIVLAASSSADTTVPTANLHLPRSRDSSVAESPSAAVRTADDGIFRVPHTDDSIPTRHGTVASARFNILSTMVGGGCLSLPLAFQQSGNGLLGPLVLILTGLLTDFCFRLLVACAVRLSPPHPTTPGKDSFESITSAAFGPKAYIMSMGLVTAMCFFGAVGYAVLLRDMMEPINDSWPFLTGGLWEDGTWIHKNFTLFLMILIVTPATTLTNLTALQNCGAASMISLLILGSCIVIRSVQCNLSAPHPWYTYVTLWPDSPRDFLNAIPLYISCFVCHYNILPVHNELQNPTPPRVSWWLRSTTWFAVGLYSIMGFAGSCYGHCTPSGKVQGNVLLDFDEKDPLLMIGRMCLALTIALAFPMLVIPARDILLRSVIVPHLHHRATNTTTTTTRTRTTTTILTITTRTTPVPVDDMAAQLQEPLLSTADEERPMGADDEASFPPHEEEHEEYEEEEEEAMAMSFRLRLLTSIAIFWTAGIVASCVASIDIVWDLLGSSLSILLSFLIPCGSYLVIMGHHVDDDASTSTTTVWWSKVFCWIMILFFVPLMFVSTGNAMANTFFPPATNTTTTTHY